MPVSLGHWKSLTRLVVQSIYLFECEPVSVCKKSSEIWRRARGTGRRLHRFRTSLVSLRTVSGSFLSHAAKMPSQGRARDAKQLRAPPLIATCLLVDETNMPRDG